MYLAFNNTFFKNLPIWFSMEDANKDMFTIMFNGTYRAQKTVYIYIQKYFTIWIYKRDSTKK